MTRLIAVDSSGTGNGLQAAPGWELEFSFNELIGTADGHDAGMSKEILEAQLLADDNYIELNRTILEQIVNDEQLNKHLARLAQADVTIGEALFVLVQQRLAELISMSDRTLLELAHIVQENLQIEDLLQKEVARSIGDQLALESLLVRGGLTLRESAVVEDEFAVEAVKLLQQSTTFSDAVYASSFKQLSDSLLLNEALAVVIISLLDDVDDGSVEEREYIEKLQSYTETLIIGSEVLLEFSSVVADQSLFTSQLFNEAFKLIVDTMALEDFLNTSQYDFDVIFSATVELNEKLTIKMSTRSRARSSSRQSSSTGSSSSGSSSTDSMSGDFSGTSGSSTTSKLTGKSLVHTTVRF